VHAPIEAPARLGGRFVIYPVVLATTWVLAVYVDTSVDLVHALRALIVAATVTAFVQAATTYAFRESGRGALATLVVAVVTIKAWPALLAIAGFGVWQLWRRARHQRFNAGSGPVAAQAAGAMNVFAGLLLGFVAFTGFARGALGLPDWGEHRPATMTTVAAPDIYVLLLDGHARADTLRDRFAAEVSPFVTSLAQRGFDVAAHSNSNYDQTSMTLVSMMYGAHIPDLIERNTVPAEARGQFRLLSEMLDTETPVSRVLRAHGYEIVTIPTSVGQFGLRDADRYLDAGTLNNLELRLVQHTIIYDLGSLLGYSVIGEQERERAKRAMDALDQLAAERDGHPKFVLAHLLLPHAPFVFDAAGGPVPPMPCLPECSMFETPLEEGDRVTLYREQSIHTHRIVLDVIDRILANSKDPPVIIVMSDHGSRLFPDDQQEELRNFFAVVTPGRTHVFPDDVTLINVFPRLFGSYLGEPLQLEPDRLFGSPGDGPWPLIEYRGSP
jgi:hypothetical protein